MKGLVHMIQMIYLAAFDGADQTDNDKWDLPQLDTVVIGKQFFAMGLWPLSSNYNGPFSVAMGY